MPRHWRRWSDRLYLSSKRITRSRQRSRPVSARSAPAPGSASCSTRATRWRASILAPMVTITIPLVAGAMSCARRARRRSPAAGASRQWHVGLAQSACLLAGLLGENLAAAQVPEGGPQTPSGPGGEAGPPTAGGGPAVAPAIPGPAPETLPPPPGGGFGTPNPVAPPYSVNNEAPTLLSPPTLRLLPPQAGVVPLQAYDPTAPAIIIQPFASVSEIFTDNVNYTHSPRNFAAITTLSPGISFSADTPRLQAVAAGSASGTIYLPSSNSSLNQVYGNLYANGHATVYPDLLFVDFQNVITQSTTLPGFGFQNLSTLPRNQQTQQYINNVSPYIVKSFDGWVDTRLRYFFSSSNYGGATAVATLPFTTLTSSTLNEGNFVAATGENFQQFSARFTADTSSYTAAPTAQNTQVSAFNDFQFRFTPGVSGLARLGYQNQHYPGSPAANFAGLTWLAGGQLGTLGPDQPAYVILEYGKQQGVYGITGAAQVNLTPTLLLTASAVQGIAAQGQLFASNLATSTLSPSGGIVNQTTGLPTAFYLPGVGLSNNVYRQHLYNVGLSEVIPPNSHSLFLFYNDFQSLTPPITAPTKSVGVNLSYSRSMRPDLTGYASVGYVNSVNAPTVAPAVSTTSFDTVTGTLGINYVLGRTLTGSILYTLSYQNNGATLAGGRTGDVIVNQLQFLLSKTF